VTLREVDHGRNSTATICTFYSTQVMRRLLNAMCGGFSTRQFVEVVGEVGNKNTRTQQETRTSKNREQRAVEACDCVEAKER
jgi:hypothetical protein